MKTTRQNTGNSGEYYLASYLSARNFVVTITLGRNEKYDLLVINPRGKAIKISVKTLYSGKSFILTKKDEKIKAPDLFYAFVTLNELKKEPEFWIVHSNIVSKSIRKNYKKWFKTPRKDKKPHNKTERRNFNCRKNKYEPKGWERKVEAYKSNIKPLLTF
jgi:hypothetical protein